jgi:succinate-semialdehyde dehydrogenase / glutarate-semialdehyde dehydrogenase
LSLMSVASINPATGERLRSFDEPTEAEVEAALAAAREAFASWRREGFAKRAGLMTAAATVLRERKPEFARLVTLEMGKPIVQSEAEIEKSAWCCDYYAENAERFLADERVDAGPGESWVSYRPLGVVLAIMPWNFPFWQLFRFAAPGLMAGNVAILKHSSNVPQCALAIADVFREAGFPEGVFQTLLLGGSRVAKLIEDPRVAAVTLTGSEATGSTVAEVSGKALKKTVLELGGSDPFVVLEDADLERAAETACTARNQNAGQSCIAAKRFIVTEPLYDRFLELFSERVSRLRVGDPLERETEVGPLARQDLVEALHEQVEASRAAGARVLAGGRKLDGSGCYYQPTVLADVTPEMRVFREETFGPVAAVTRASGEEEAIALANDTQYGLGANLWTGDPDRARRLAGEIEAGLVFVNGMVASDPRLPFGGVKRSGYGRELSSHGIREFVNVQTVRLVPPAAPGGRAAE